MSKIFIRGLNYKTTRDSLTSYFRKYGPIEKANIATDVLSGQSRGFGFVTFENQEDANKALEIPSHEIDGRIVHASPARPKGSAPYPESSM